MNHSCKAVHTLCSVLVVNPQLMKIHPACACAKTHPANRLGGTMLNHSTSSCVICTHNYLHNQERKRYKHGSESEKRHLCVQCDCFPAAMWNTLAHRSFQRWQFCADLPLGHGRSQVRWNTRLKSWPVEVFRRLQWASDEALQLGKK